MNRIGTDESGKGDFFGPLVIAGVFVEEEKEKFLQDLKVRDSKNISDSVIEVLDKEIKENCPYSVVAIGPEKYNQLYQTIKNLNRLLAWGHSRCIENLLEKVDCQRAIADQFGDEKYIQKALMEKGKKIILEQRTRAESDLAVASASILARAEFIRRLDRLSQAYQIQLPKGAGEEVVKTGKLLVEKYGQDILTKVAKIHFKTARQILT